MNPFEFVIKKMIELGFYEFLFPFIITSAIFFGLLKKSKVLGESIAINAAIALSIAFFIFGFPVIVGLSLATPFATFFTQTTAFILVFVIGFIIASMFYPNMMEWLPKVFERRSWLFIAIAIGFGVFLMSGLVQVVWHGITAPPKPGEAPKPPADVLTIVAGLVIFAILLIIAASVVRVE